MNIHTIDHVGLIYTKNNSVLHQRPIKTEEWILPGGELLGGETYLLALSRAVKEQLSLNIDPKSVNFIKTYLKQSYGKSGSIKIKITCFSADIKGSLKSTSTNEIKFLSYKDKHSTSMISQMVFDDLRDQGIIS